MHAPQRRRKRGFVLVQMSHVVMILQSHAEIILIGQIAIIDLSNQNYLGMLA